MRAEDWISVSARVPEDRRRVLVWCVKVPTFLRREGPAESRYNPSPQGGRFEVEVGGTFSATRVTHWQEIVGPPEPAVAPPPKQP